MAHRVDKYHVKTLHAFVKVVEFEKAVNGNIPPILVVDKVQNFWDTMGAEAVRDLAAWIEWATLNGLEDYEIAVTVGHDLNGAGSECFSPRSTGYAKHLEEYHAEKVEELKTE